MEQNEEQPRVESPCTQNEEPEIEEITPEEPTQLDENESYVAMVNRYIMGILNSTFAIRNILMYRCCRDTEEEVIEEVKDDAEDPDSKIEAVSKEETADPEKQDVNVVKRSQEENKRQLNIPSIDIEKIGTNEAIEQNQVLNEVKLPKGETRTERVMQIFVENSIIMTKAAMKEKKVIFADKILCNMLQKIHFIYGDEEDKSTWHPLVNVMERLPKDTPNSIKEMIETVAKDEAFMTNAAEKIFVIDLFTKFNMTLMKQHILDYKQHVIAKLWESSIETAEYESRQSIHTDDGSGRKKLDSIDKPRVSFRDEVDVAESSNDSPRVVRQTDNVRLPNTVELNDKTRRARTSRYLSYASKFMYTKKYTKFGQHFSKNKVKTADGWTKALYGSIETFYRSESDGSISVKVRGKLHTDLIRVICVINETQLSAEWIPFLKEASNVYVYSKTTKVFKQTYEYPVIGIKQTSVFGIAINALDESGCFILGCRAPPETKEDVDNLTNILKKGGIKDTESIVAFRNNKCILMGQEIEPIEQKYRQKSAELCFMLYPMQNHTLVELNANIIPEVRLVPQRVITYIIKKVIITLFQKIAQISNNFQESPFAKQVEQNREFYAWVERLYAKYMGNGDRQNCNVSISTYDGNAGEE
ncbi:hypothetical protein BBOV_III011850 [Babesia bovis T2Bo]|uniref:START domain-containing protein n=1 Tax=Babesia bovis TaxID=5865 RepID=A7AQA3_BABBO|nr:hypothetical protein BBOV_III011850 [Babesia bovis T2Bo]EDO08737.1 hypothetical protein BBOV_III011850 [Babesia bovis T2Bo]|eukprot:XP_001612305.1 hypothetical protein [Babesia bovis T2Bo]